MANREESWFKFREIVVSQAIGKGVVSSEEVRLALKEARRSEVVGGGYDVLARELGLGWAQGTIVNAQGEFTTGTMDYLLMDNVKLDNNDDRDREILTKGWERAQQFAADQREILRSGRMFMAMRKGNGPTVVQAIGRWHNFWRLHYGEGNLGVIEDIRAEVVGSGGLEKGK